MKIFLMTLVESHYTGINSKIIAQKNALINLGHECFSGFFTALNDDHMVYSIEGTSIKEYHRKLFKLERYTNLSSIFNWIIENNIQLVYFRYCICANPLMIRFFRRLTQHGIRIMAEIPTFPYDGEIISSGSYHIHKYFRKSLLKYVEKIVTFSDDKQIYGIPTINIDNALCVENYPIKKHVPLTDEFHLIGVANVSFWHGFDRIIKSIYQYNKSFHEKKIIFHIVGGSNNSPDYANLVNLTKEYDITDYIIFHGEKTGIELDKLFDISHMAVGSLGRHRSGISTLKALKNNEYACRGIPFIYSENNPLYDSEDYVYKITPDESIIDLEVVILYYKRNNFNPSYIHEKFLTKNLTWENQFKKLGF